MTKNKEILDHVLSISCYFVKENNNYNCNIGRRIETLEGVKTITFGYDNVIYVGANDTEGHITEITRMYLDNDKLTPMSAIVFDEDVNCELFEEDLDNGKMERQIKCY